MKLSTRQWFARGLRLSVIVGLANAAVYSWTVFSQFTEAVERTGYTRRGYECAARLDDEVLTARIGTGGKINVGDICGTGKDFIVAPNEIAEVRSGTMKFETYVKPFKGTGTLEAGLFGTIATILATATVLGGISAARWVWGSRQG